MHKEVLRAIVGIDVFPVVSLVLFVAVFGAAVVRALRLDRRLVDELSSLPLDASQPALPEHPALSTQHSALK